MEPATGASTWALGNHRWAPYRGILTINAVRHPSHNILSVVWWEVYKKLIESEPVE